MSQIPNIKLSRAKYEMGFKRFVLYWSGCNELHSIRIVPNELPVCYPLSKYVSKPGQATENAPEELMGLAASPCRVPISTQRSFNNTYLAKLLYTPRNSPADEEKSQRLSSCLDEFKDQDSEVILNSSNFEDDSLQSDEKIILSERINRFSDTSKEFEETNPEEIKTEKTKSAENKSEECKSESTECEGLKSEATRSGEFKSDAAKSEILHKVNSKDMTEGLDEENMNVIQSSNEEELAKDAPN